MVNVAINGLGRIGRSLLRARTEYDLAGVDIVALNGLSDIDDHVHMLKYDSIHGKFDGAITKKGRSINMGPIKAEVFNIENPVDLPWKDIGVDVVLECTGKFNDKNKASQHLKAGANIVIVSAPCKGADATIVLGVNEGDIKDHHEVLSMGSCTTNCLAPMAKLLEDHIGIEHGFMTTIHAYTNDQNLVDSTHKDKRRARAAAMSLIPTTTGAASAIGLVIPSLHKKIEGAAVRAPVANVSMIDFCFRTKRDTSVEEVVSIMRGAAAESMAGLLDVVDEPLVSVDFNHNPCSAIFDVQETKVIDGRLCRVVAWYDNEWAFSLRMLELVLLLAKVRRY
jgi:glyceraldehyde 3-phosphate dehydrogenase